MVGQGGDAGKVTILHMQLRGPAVLQGAVPDQVACDGHRGISRAQRTIGDSTAHLIPKIGFTTVDEATRDDTGRRIAVEGSIIRHATMDRSRIVDHTGIGVRDPAVDGSRIGNHDRHRSSWHLRSWFPNW